MEANSKIGLGVIGEKFTNSVAKSIFKVKDGYRVKHVDWGNYSYGHGLDLRVFKRNKQVMAIEVKNWREMNHPYGTETAETEIIDRFQNYAGGIKVLIISLLCLLTKKALELLEAHNIHVIEIGKLIGSRDFPRRKSKTRKGRYSKVFHSVRSNLLELWLNLKRQARQSFLGYSCVGGKQVRLDEIDINDKTNNTKPNKLEQNKQYDTASKKQASNYAYRLLKRAMRLEELKRKHPMYRFIPSSWLD